MAFKKYINTMEVVKRTGRPYNETLNLAKSGVLPGHKTRRGHYRLNIPDLEKYFGIQINKPEKQSTPDDQHPQGFSNLHLITENFFEEVIKRACAAKCSIKIMTADFNRLRLKPTKKQGGGKEMEPLSLIS